MEDSDLLSLDDESSGKFFYVGDEVTLNVIPGVALVLVGAMLAIPLLGALINFLPSVPSGSSGYGRVSQGYDYDDTFYDKEYRGYYDDDESEYAASAPKPARYKVSAYKKRVKT